MRKTQFPSRPVFRSVSRRDVLRTGGLLIPTLSIMPGLLVRTAWAQSATTFDYYISPHGSDSNPGTLASPWAITALNTKQSTYGGKRVGIIGDQGTYDVSSLMNSSFHTPVLNINGGASASQRTYVGSANSSGVYTRGLATIDAKGASGVYGGGNSHVSSIIGQGYETNVPANKGNFVIDGLKLTGFSMWAVHFGNYDGGTASCDNATIQNCEIYGGNAQSNTTSSGVNLAPIVVYRAANPVITNNYIHDNAGWTDPDHFSGMYLWGLNGSTHDGTISYNTLVNTGNIHSKEATQYNWQVYNNYIDMTKKTPSGGSSQNAACIFGFNADGGRGTLTTIHHNICLGYGVFVDLTNDTGQNGWSTPVAVYNNTFVNVGANSAHGAGFRAYETTAGSRPVKFYNNLYVDNGQPVGGYGYIQVDSDIFSVSDYNIFGATANQFGYVPPGGLSSASENTTSFANWKAQTGSDAHSSVSGSGMFTSAGAGPLQYQVAIGSPAYATGRVGGVSTGTTCNVGAWDGTVAQIGSGAPPVVPDAPVLSVS